MPRPRTHDPDVVLDAAESLAVRGGPAAVTIRAVAAATGVSNGALYHTFGSRSGVLGRAWLRAARRFLAVQNELVDAAAGSEGDSGVGESKSAARQSNSAADAVRDEAIVAAAEAPSVFAERFPDSSRLLLTVSREQLLGEDLPEDVAAEVRAAERALIDLLVRLAQRRWGRRDRRAVEVLTTCLVDLPTALLIRRERIAEPFAREQLRAAVRAVLAVGPPP
ncbi:TetR/AcrR family transcriptional regulator [Nocardia amikacinitolerans]|uniref:TetR/AcrR family transcriptional regulator n=1 Tax=Nocardia amikacinitolerans TaxID=756689 RepID=UPI0020A53D3D|nr:TetR/AcrR family transcriptional regulator [Nocardia amikacinitolerans]MCP2292585.1 transcriptional regulator, TetR family [Nocardia amikacinitolerans]